MPIGATYTINTDQLAIMQEFPENIHIAKLLGLAHLLRVRIVPSDIPEQWLYHPGYRAIWVWLPDLKQQPLSYTVVMLAHELGHAIDFDQNPQWRDATASLMWWEMPPEIECSAFVRGFHILKSLNIPFTLKQYLTMIEEPMSSMVGNILRLSA